MVNNFDFLEVVKVNRKNKNTFIKKVFMNTFIFKVFIYFMYLHTYMYICNFYISHLLVLIRCN